MRQSEQKSKQAMVVNITGLSECAERLDVYTVCSLLHFTLAGLAHPLIVLFTFQYTIKLPSHSYSGVHTNM